MENLNTACWACHGNHGRISRIDREDSMLISLCEDCHKKEHDYLNGSMAEIRELISMAKGDGYLIEDISSLIEIALTVSKNRSNLLRLISDLSKINKSQG